MASKNNADPSTLGSGTQGESGVRTRSQTAKAGDPRPPASDSGAALTGGGNRRSRRASQPGSGIDHHKAPNHPLAAGLAAVYGIEDFDDGNHQDDMSSVATLSTATNLFDLNMAMFTSWLRAPKGIVPPDLLAYYRFDVVALTRQDHRRISQLMEAVVEASTPDEIHAIHSLNPYVVFLLWDCSTRLSRGHRQGLSQDLLIRCRRRIRDIVRVCRLLDGNVSTLCASINIQRKSWLSQLQQPHLLALRDLPITGLVEDLNPVGAGFKKPNPPQPPADPPIQDDDVHMRTINDGEQFHGFEDPTPNASTTEEVIVDQNINIDGIVDPSVSNTVDEGTPEPLSAEQQDFLNRLNNGDAQKKQSASNKRDERTLEFNRKMEEVAKKFSQKHPPRRQAGQPPSGSTLYPPGTTGTRPRTSAQNGMPNENAPNLADDNNRNWQPDPPGLSRPNRDGQRSNDRNERPNGPPNNRRNNNQGNDGNNNQNSQNRRRRRRDCSSDSSENDETLPIIEQTPGPEYYETLPPPWNVAPVSKRGHRATKALEKSDVLKKLKFTGTVGSYLQWRPMFISYVHLRRIPNFQKCYYIANTIDEKVKELAPLLDICIMREGDSYRNAILWLERIYGGTQRAKQFYHQQIRQLTPLRENDYDALQSLLTLLTRLRSAFNTHGLQHELTSGLLIDLLKEKLPRSYIDAYQVWMDVYYDQDEVQLFTLESIIRWLEGKQDRLLNDRRLLDIDPKPKSTAAVPAKPKLRVVQLCACGESYENNYGNSPPDDLSEPLDIEQVFYVRTQQSVAPECTLCPRVPHLYRDCEKFLAMTVEQRRKHLREQNKCFRCFRTGHNLGDCKSRITCKHCKDIHHSLACPKTQKTMVNVQINNSADNLDDGAAREFTDPDGEGNVYTAAQINQPKTSFRCSLPIVALVVQNPVNKQKVSINALLDEGANRTSMSMAVAKMIGLQGSQIKFRASGFGDTYMEDKSAMEADITISDLKGRLNYNCTVVCLENPLGNLTPDDWSLYKRDWSHLRDVQIAPVLVDRQVHMIIGTDNVCLQAAQTGDIIGPDCTPSARKTVFGWVARGRVFPEQPVDQVNLVNDEIDSLVVNCHQFLVRTRDEPAQVTIRDPLDLSCCFSGVKSIGPGQRPPFVQKQIERRLDNFRQIQEAYDKDLLELLRLQYRIDEAPQNEPDMSIEDRYAYRKMKASEKHTGQRYQVDCLWKKGEPKLVYNKINAVSRYQRLRKNPLYKSKYEQVYVDTLKDYLSKDYIERVPQEEVGSTDSFYLPHFVVSKTVEDKTKYRIVFDGAAKYANKSLNDAQAKGPNFIADLVKVLIQFRRHPYAIAMDVKEMFLQVQMDPKSRKYHRFVFQWPNEEYVTDYQFTRHPFGSTGSPCIAMHIVRQRAIEMRDQYPEAADLILRYSIIDDAMTSAPSLEAALKIYSGVKAILSKCSMELHKIASNSPELLRQIPTMERAKGFDADDFLKQNCPSTYTLGMLWRSSTDLYTFAAREIDLSTITMRTILKHTASIFDPIGIVSPFIVQARLIVQNCFKAELKWDDPVTPDIKADWIQFAEDLKSLPSYKLDRCLEPVSGKVTLHVFSDASVKAFSAAAYFVVQSETTTQSILITSKTKVAPLTKTTIPRLELLGAIEATKVAEQISDALGISTKDIQFWTDNQCVLAWIRLRTKALSTYVANRVEMIQEVSETNNWRYVPTNLNPADIGSRGASVSDLASSALWLQGPDFLVKGEVDWPQQPLYYLPAEAQSEVKMENLDNNVTVLLAQEVPPEPEPWHWEAVMKRSFNSYTRLITAVALCKRYVRILQEIVSGQRQKPTLITRDTSVTVVKQFGKIKGKYTFRSFSRTIECTSPDMNERQRAEVVIFKQVQLIHFDKVIRQLKKNGRLNFNHPYFKWFLELDSEGVLRQAGRLSHNENLRKEVRYPVFIPANSELTRLILQDTHENLNHTRSVNHIFNNLTHFKFTKGVRQVIRTFVRECFYCKRLWPRPLGQRMGPIPDFRVPTGDLRPFATTTIDAAGPFETRQGRGKTRTKRYLLLFTCTVVRAVHIEVMYGITTDDFLCALSRFCNERSSPVTIICDNAGQFVKGAKLLQFTEEETHEVQRKSPSISFQFTPARTPHVNGVTERIIGSMKASLKTTITDGLFTDDQLLTAAKRVQGILNSRPLAYSSTSADEPEALTPGHFLADQALRDIYVEPDHLDYNSKYRLVQTTMEEAWKRFQKEVLPRLNAVSKWHKDQPNLQVGDVVIVMDSEETSKFPLGVVTEVFPGADGLVRIVTVRIRGHETKRHASRLMLLIREP